MDFFQNQDRARRNTSLLVFYFVMAVVLIVVSIYAVFAAIFLRQSGENPALSGPTVSSIPYWDPALFAGVGMGTLAVISGGSLYRIASLAGGGRTVAEMLHGRLIPPDTTVQAERKVLNVVEEMAIASGVPVPPVYILEHEKSINAFAAGHTPGDAVIGVTRGTVELLSRDELQGVIAHEFSHILNGDMKLNLRLMGVLFGILVISMVGYMLLRTTSFRSRARSDGKGGNPLPLIGLGLYVIGYVGVIGGRLIKSAISRQREYLADASAVQFTRNPEGIAGALKKIGALSEGSRIQDAEAEEVSHMFFGSAMGGSWFGLMATHPPLADRIRRIDPSFDGDFQAVRKAVKSRDARKQMSEEREDQKRAPRRGHPALAIDQIGTLDPARVAMAATLLESIPAPLTDQAREPFSARALVFALLLDRDEADLRQNQLANLGALVDAPTIDLTGRLFPRTLAAGPAARLPLVELALPALRRMSPNQYQAFKAATEQLMTADRRLDLFEFATQRMMLRNLAPQFEPTTAWPERSGTRRRETVFQPTLTLLAAVARAGASPRSAPADAFRAGIDALGWSGSTPESRVAVLGDAILPEAPIGLREVGEALDRLAGAAPVLKKDVLRACAAAISVDGHTTVEEAELFRAISDALDCPMPLIDPPSNAVLA